MSAYWPYPDALAHAHCCAGTNAVQVAVVVVALSIADPSPHSLNVVIRCQCVVVDATMFVTSVANLALSRDSRGPLSPAFQNPGLTV